MSHFDACFFFFFGWGSKIKLWDAGSEIRIDTEFFQIQSRVATQLRM